MIPIPEPEMIRITEPETIPGDREGDYPVTNGNHTDMIILVIIFAIIFAAVSRYF